MSKAEPVKIKCPKCHKEEEFEVWHSINTKEPEELISKVKNGTIFNYTCKECNLTIPVVYSMLFNDMEKEYMVYLIPSADDKQIEECNEIYSKIKVKDNYRFRVVKDINEFIDKMLVFDLGLNDVVIELIKSNLKESLPKESIQNVKAIYFISKTAENLRFYLLGAKNNCCEVPILLYNELVKNIRLKKIDSFAYVDMLNVTDYIEQ